MPDKRALERLSAKELASTLEHYSKDDLRAALQIVDARTLRVGLETIDAPTLKVAVNCLDRPTLKVGLEAIDKPTLKVAVENMDKATLGVAINTVDRDTLSAMLDAVDALTLRAIGEFIYRDARWQKPKGALLAAVSALTDDEKDEATRKCALQVGGTAIATRIAGLPPRERLGAVVGVFVASPECWEVLKQAAAAVKKEFHDWAEARRHEEFMKMDHSNYECERWERLERTA